MKLSILIVAALSLTSNAALLEVEEVAHPLAKLLPRVREPASKPRPESYRSKGLNRDKADPPYRAAHTEEDAQRARDIIAKNRAQTPPRRSSLEKSQTPEEGETGFKYDKDEVKSKAYFGDDLERASRHIRQRQERDPREKGYPYQPRAENSEERKEGNKQRRGAYNTEPTEKGLNIDHKGTMSSHVPVDNQVSTAIYDTEKSQGLEGTLIGQANKPVRRDGYRDKTDRSTWKEKPGSGVELIPNARNKDPIRPIIGPKESKPYKYSVEEDSENEVAPRKRDRGSRSSSGDSQSLTLVSRPRRKTRRPDYYAEERKIRRRGVVGVDAIADSQAAASTPQSSNSTTPEEVQPYLDAWVIVKANATDIVWPYIVDMLVGTNSSVVITAAWSIYAHLIPSPYDVQGPFFAGMDSLASQEEQWASSNMSHSDLQALYAINDVVVDLYSTAWNGAYNALNSSGVLGDMEMLEAWIAYYNASIPADTYTPANPNGTDPYADFFLSYLGPVPDDELDLDFNKTIKNEDVICYPSGSGEAPVASGTAAPGPCIFNTNGTLDAPYPTNTLATVYSSPTDTRRTRDLKGH